MKTTDHSGPPRAASILFGAGLLWALLIPGQGLAAVPGDPCPAAGLTQVNGGPEQIPALMLVCDGVEWRAVMETGTDGRSVFQVDNDSGACGAEKTGRMRYNESADTWEYCGGGGPGWLPFEHAAGGGLSGPAGCGDIGDLCADGTVFAGWHPITYEHLFIPTTDQGTTQAWKTSTGVDDIAADSSYDGRVNSGQVANSTTFPALKLCKDLGTGGYNDWYLPSQVELYYLWSVHGMIQAGGNIVNFQTASYWSSSEAGNYDVWVQFFPDGYGIADPKAELLRVRCIRR